MKQVILPLFLAVLAGAGVASAAEPALGVLVGTYTDGDSRGIYRLRFDEETGRLDGLGLAAETASPSFLAVDPQGRFLFAVNENDKVAPGSGGVSSFAIEAKTGALRFLSQQPSGGAWPCHLVLDQTGRYLFVANYGGSATLLPVSAEGQLSPVVARVDPKGQGPHARQKGSHAHGVYLDATNRRLFVPDLGLDQVLVYAFDAAAAKLTPETPPFAAVAPGAGPRHLAWSPDFRFLHAVNELDSTVTTFAWDPAAGLEPRGVVKTLPDDFRGESYTAEIAVHPNGRFAYVSNRGHDSLAVFAVDSSSGALRRTAVVPVGGKKPRHFAISPSGRFLLAAHQESNTISVFRLDPSTGSLTAVGSPVSVPRPVCILFLPR
ncbi:MAG TPA: lactonase family protein [Vicinamibacteria bacterium]